MRKGLKYVLALGLFLGTVQVHNTEATPHRHKKQVKATDSIVMSRDEFVNILADAVRKRRKQLLQVKKLQRLTVNTSNTESNLNYARRIERLEDQLHQLTLLLIQNKSNNLGTIPSNGGTVPVNYVPVQQPVQNIAQPKDTKVVVDDSALANEIDRLKALNNQMNQKPKHVVNAKSPYAGQTSEVFFANNKYNLSAESIAKVNAVAELLKADDNLDVMIKGFASKVGGTMHNQELSLKRSDVVKQAFISKGIASGRVLTTYHGEDFSNRSEAESRRVDIIILDNRE